MSGGVGRKGLGIPVLIAGVGGAILRARADDAREIEQHVTDAAVKAVTGSVHVVSLTAVGRDIRPSGLADSETERISLLAAADAVVS